MHLQYHQIFHLGLAVNGIKQNHDKDLLEYLFELFQIYRPHLFKNTF